MKMSKSSHYNRELNLYKLALAHKDIRAAELTCEGYKKLIIDTVGKLPYDVNYAFMGSIITSYSRPFVDNKSSGVLPGRWRKFGDPRLQATHDAIIKARHEVYAHSDSAVSQLWLVPAGSVMKGIGRIAPRASWKFHTYEVPPDAILDYHACCMDLKERLEKEVSTLVEEYCAQKGIQTEEFELKWKG
jgi:hypothetical protein